eukprot:11519752-Ditylum_brightwellii.AAC.1
MMYNKEVEINDHGNISIVTAVHHTYWSCRICFKFIKAKKQGKVPQDNIVPPQCCCKNCAKSCPPNKMEPKAAVMSTEHIGRRDMDCFV